MDLNSQSERTIFAIKEQVEILERFVIKGEARREQEIKEYLDLLKSSESIAKPIDPTDEIRKMRMKGELY
ncbi:MAG: hypothetical protein ISS94_00895 [Candidatus Syntrophoarchaeum sp.]|nr:hypothetical protein [Methanomicrobia archaeon]MBL7117330.1 hypothetical protein [Candidatus Syntrophoarchaeum sp.]